jgi:hypothetical protein
LTLAAIGAMETPIRPDLQGFPALQGPVLRNNPIVPQPSHSENENT